MINSLAYFDALSVITHLQKIMGGVLKEEVQVFSYLACLLFLYDEKKPVSDWGYYYAGTPEGAPFSLEIEEAIEQLFRLGLVEKDSDCYKVSQSGLIENQFLYSLSQNKIRERFIEGACSSILIFPMGFIRESILNEPELLRVKQLESKRILLEGPGLKAIYEQFAALSSVLGTGGSGLMIPASVWLNYLFNVRMGASSTNGN